LSPAGPAVHDADMRTVLLFLALLPFSAVAQTLTAGEAFHRIQERYPHPAPDTVDTLKGGDPSTPVTGIATTFLDTMDVLKEANRRGLNLVISHEPTFYNHRDDTTFFADDPVYLEKKAFIEQHHMVVYRLHDAIHSTPPDPFGTGMIELLGWQKYNKGPDPYHFTVPPTKLSALVKELQTKLNARTLRYEGDPNLVVTNIAVAPGASGLETQVKGLRPDDIQLLIAGEASEWETVEYVRDAISQGRKKALILLGHEVSEEPGMEKATEHLRVLFPNLKVEHIVAGNPLKLP
jgi:putative NIF3 family GTP cyclohydrolase 1 type 2